MTDPADAGSSEGTKTLSKAALYRTLDDTSRKKGIELGLLKESVNLFSEDFLTQCIPSEKFDKKEFVKYYFSLEPSAPKTTPPTYNRKRLSAAYKRQMQLFKLQPQEKSYRLFLPLHHMWVDYMRTLLQAGKHLQSSSYEHLYTLLMKADYHGCLLVVTRTTCPSYFGAKGIMVQETKNIFTLITEDSKVKMIPKQNSVFAFELDGHLFTIYGNHFRVKASERSARKFKAKPTLDL